MTRFRNYALVPLTLGLIVSTAASETRGLSTLPAVRPEAVGFSSVRLQRFDSLLQQMVARKELPGVIVMGARHGKVFHSSAYGLRDLEHGSPVQKDTIFRIYSMSRPILGVAMMILYEEGKWSPREPVSKYIPEFSSLKVFKGLDTAGKVLLEVPGHAPTMRELMTHTAGFSYGFGDDPVNKLYRDDSGYNVMLGAPSLQDMIDRLSRVPLLYQPGARWVYSISVDIQGYLVQKLSGVPLPEFLKTRIFIPLGMRDTGFYVPQEKRDRFATLYHGTSDGDLVAVDHDFVAYGLDPRIPAFTEKDPSTPLGGTGLVSTARDYLRFAQMLLNGGELEGVRILGPQTVKLMRSNHLAEMLMATDWGQAGTIIPRSMGYGFDVGVVTDPGIADTPCGAGTYMWSGAAGTWFWIDPANDIAAVGMTQRIDTPANVQSGELARQMTYQALLDSTR